MKFVSTCALTLFVIACGGREANVPTATETTASTATTSTTETTNTSATLAPAPAPQGVEPVAGPKLSPIDDASKDPSFVAYREKLRTAVKARDVNALRPLIDPKIRTSFGSGGGVDDLEKLLARPGMWETFDTVLAHGGTFLGDDPKARSFWSPYVYSAWPEERDAFTHLAVIGENIPLHKSADDDSEIVATLSYDIVERASEPGADEGAWRRIKTADGRTGYVTAKDVLSPVGYRAGFSQVNGAWRMNAFVAGD